MLTPLLFSSRKLSELLVYNMQPQGKMNDSLVRQVLMSALRPKSFLGNQELKSDLFMSSTYRYLFVLLIPSLVLAPTACSSDQATEPELPTVRMTDENSEILRFPVSGDGKVDSSAVAAFTFDLESHNFGTVTEGTIVRHRFTFRNSGRQPLRITKAQSSCGCTVPSYPEQPVAPGDTSSILVSFDTKDKQGNQDKVITLQANTYPNITELHLIGTVDPRS